MESPLAAGCRGVFEVALPAGETLLVHRHAELPGHRVDVPYVQVNQRVRSGVALVLREVEANWPTGDRDEPRESRLELVLRLLVESEAPIPIHGATRILDVQHRNNGFLHARTLSSRRTVRRLAYSRCNRSTRP